MCICLINYKTLVCKTWGSQWYLLIWCTVCLFKPSRHNIPVDLNLDVSACCVIQRNQTFMCQQRIISTTACLNPFQPKLILVHTIVTGTCRRAYKTCKNWPLCSYVGWHQHSQQNAEKSEHCAKMTTGANGQKAYIFRTDEKHDAIWHHGAGKG